MTGVRPGLDCDGEKVERLLQFDAAREALLERPCWAEHDSQLDAFEAWRPSP